MAFKMNGFSGFQKKSAAYKKVNPEETFTPMANQDPADIEKNERKLRPEDEFSTFRNNKLPTTDVVGTNSDEVKYTTKTKENNKRKVTKYFDPETGKKLGKKVNTRNKNTKVKATTNTIKKEEVDKDYFKGKTKEENMQQMNLDQSNY